MAGEIVLPNVRLAAYRFTLRLEEPARLSPYMGSTLRGGFGHAFKRLVCFERERETCDGCLLRHTCPYACLFEPTPPPGAEVLRAESDVPPAFVLEPRLDWQTAHAAGDALEFGLTLVGRGISFLPYFLIVFRELGKQGLGRDRARYVLEEVVARRPLDGGEERLYAAGEPEVRDLDLSAGWPALGARAADLPADRLAIEFLTPARLKHGAAYHEQPAFHVLVRALLRRVSSLAYFHGGQRWEIDFRGWIARAEQVRTAEAGARWVEWERYSTRQGQRTSLGGTVGRMAYEGDLAAFMPLLALGEWLHVGKACVFGNGRYRLRGGRDGG